MYDDQTLINNIQGKLTPGRSGEIDAAVLSSSIGSELHDRYWKLSVYEAVCSKKAYARHICSKHRSGSPDDDADDLLTRAYEKLVRRCEKVNEKRVQINENEIKFVDAEGSAGETLKFSVLQCELQILGLNNRSSFPKKVRFESLKVEAEIAAADEDNTQIAYRLLKSSNEVIVFGPKPADKFQIKISVVPLKRYLKKTLTNLSFDINLAKLPAGQSSKGKKQKSRKPNEDQETLMGRTNRARRQAAEYQAAEYQEKRKWWQAKTGDDGSPRYAARSDRLQSFDGNVGLEGEVSEESLLSQQRIDEMRREAIDKADNIMGKAGKEVHDFLQSDQFNPDLREALLLRINGEDYDDIAKICDISEGNARKRVCKARMALIEGLPEIHELLKENGPGAKGRSGDEDES